jgi:hypothetical protein
MKIIRLKNQIYIYISYQLINALRHERKFVVYSDFLREKKEREEKEKEMNCAEYKESQSE